MLTSSLSRGFETEAKTRNYVGIFKDTAQGLYDYLKDNEYTSVTSPMPGDILFIRTTLNNVWRHEGVVGRDGLVYHLEDWQYQVVGESDEGMWYRYWVAGGWYIFFPITDYLRSPGGGD